MILESIVTENIKSLSKETIVFEKDNCLLSYQCLTNLQGPESVLN
jgi:hypothetical protein